MTWISWRFSGTHWERIGTAESLGESVSLACKLYPLEMAHENGRFAATSGGIPSWIPRKWRHKLPTPDVTPKEQQ